MHNRICRDELSSQKGAGCGRLNKGTLRSKVMDSPDRTLEEILNLAAVHFKVPREKLRPDDDFFKTLGIDSLQTLDLLTKLENHFRVELPDYELQGVSDFRTLADRIRARL
jgi:acyl carrier protein